MGVYWKVPEIIYSGSAYAPMGLVWCGPMINHGGSVCSHDKSWGFNWWEFFLG
jgi:hypothetical protein